MITILLKGGICMGGINVSADEILKKYGLEAEAVEPTVYKVINTDKEINVSKLQWELKECTTIISSEIRLEKENHTGMTIANVYYVILEYGNREKTWKYQKSAKKLFDKAVIDSYSEEEEKKQYISI